MRSALMSACSIEDIHRLDDPLAGRREPQIYFACPECGWCGPLRALAAHAVRDGERHMAAKAEAAR